jgi:thiamine-phosphate pyrophosphorylase
VKLPRFYPILDTATLAQRGLAPVEAAREILAAGASILQFRHKDLWTREIWQCAEAVAAEAARAGAVFVINDRADFARLLNAALHLGQDDLPPAGARRVVGAATPIGFSTHNEAQLRAANAEPVEYLALGPLFGTASKQNPDPVVGLAEFRRLRSLTTKPLAAIGGITRANAREALAAGADSLAVIGDVFPESGHVGGRVEEWLRLTE